ncbi:TetR/AcrR family transcriptional regulator [Amycolatopsis tucumanensis]|uniref:TetR/AcrR family transcriptional regulator n=1 Tax=Amycolatopsis tucumanensis TaxID=401106 RepID=UPI003D760714
MRGRPRSEEARRAILDTALRICHRDGYPQVTIKAIADEAGVGRQTVYRWWPDKAQVLLDALIDLREREPRLDEDTGDALRDIERILARTFALTHESTGRALVGLMADAQNDPALSDRLQGTVIGPRRDVLHRFLRQGVEAGQLAENVPLPLVADFAFGTMWYRLLSRHAPVDDRLAADITAAIARLLAR